MESNYSVCTIDKCTGCAACANICNHNAIEMCYGEEGFLFPHIDKIKCVDCGLCKITCPANNPVSLYKEPIGVYSGWSKDDNVRMRSASGGAFAEIASFFIKHYNAVVFGVAMNQNLDAVHVSIEKIEDLYRLQGSKYIQSHIGDAYRQTLYFLQRGRFVLFSGTPCQIGGLRKFLKKDYETLFTIDLICHGVPSKRIFIDYIKYIEGKLGHRVRDIKFREKKCSWIFFNIAVNEQAGISNKNIYEYEGGYFEDPFIRAFLRDNILRPSCYQCQYTKTKRTADYTLADWWGYAGNSRMDKDFEQKGVSLIFCNTHKSFSLIKNMNILLRQRTLTEALETNKSLQYPFVMPSTRKEFWSDYSVLNFSQIVDKWFYCEKLLPSTYIKYKYRPSMMRKILLKFAHLYEKCQKLI